MNFQTQKKILQPILKSNKNNNCADCNAISPTWASLDFGVFLCSNCSGAHRALGPTVTRVKSATLDLWQQEWIDSMLIGNQQLNAYWEADARCYEKKPKWSSSSQDISRYVYQKYIKRKYVKDINKPDPLTLYKQQKYQPKPYQQAQKVEVKKPVNYFEDDIMQQAPAVMVSQPKVENDLIDFNLDTNYHNSQPQLVTHPQMNQTVPYEQNKIPQNHLNYHLNIQNIPVQRQYTDVAEHGTSFTSENSAENFISFDEMITNHANNPSPSPLIHSLSTQHVHRPTFTIPHIAVNPIATNHNIPVNQLNPHYQQNYQQNQFFNHQYPQSPQPILHFQKQTPPQYQPTGQIQFHYQQPMNPPHYWQ